MRRAVPLALAMAASLAAGCASTRGGQDIACDGFDTYASIPAPSGLVQDIQRYAPGSESGLAAAQSAGTSPLDVLISREVFGTTPEADAAAAAGDGRSAESIIVERPFPMRNMLLLSGGGQWGAYGAGLFLGLVCKQDPVPANRNQTPCLDENRQIIRDARGQPMLDFSALDEMNIGLITGVSTGGLQSLLLTVVLDKFQTPEARTAALQQLLDSYAPESEKELVDRSSFEAVIFTGSVAGTNPLRGHVRDVLTQTYELRDPIRDPETQAISGFTSPAPRRLIDQIGKSPITTVAGIVEGAVGRFKYVDMRAMIQKIALEERLAALRGRSEAGDQTEEADKATRCVLATTMASAAMPVFHQQLRVLQQRPESAEAQKLIRERTLFDGGVRRSVFVSEIGDIFRTRYSTLTGRMSDAAYDAALREGRLPRVYVLRNGPTTSKDADDVDDVSTARPQAMRAYGLLVNELEVGSIAALRLANPYGPIEVSTADGAEAGEASTNAGASGVPREPCTKGDEMFNPAFMRCLQNFGARRALRLEKDTAGDPIPPFWDLRPIAKRPPPGDSGAATPPVAP